MKSEFWLASVLLVSLMTTIPTTASAQSAASSESNVTYVQEMTTWRQKREERLKSETGWLSVAGLHWLNEGDNTLGTGANNDFVLPANSASPRVGVLTLHGNRVRLRVADGVTVTVNDKPVTETQLKTDADGRPDRVAVGGLTFTIIRRGKRIGIRLWDRNARTRADFTGLKWFPVDPALRITATFVPYNPPRKVGIANILGDTEEATVPGYVSFTLNGHEYHLDTQDEGETLFINFKDLTNGKATYPPGRFIDAPKPVDGKVILDFNQAYNPPCSFTAFATCPLPPPQNRLPIAIEAGEKRYHASDDEFVPTGQKVEFAADIAAFLKADQEKPPQKGQILFIGSSIIREWQDLAAQMAPLPVFNRGFGGSRTWDVLHYASDIALPYEPKIIVYYAGSNDINNGEKAEAILERYRQFSDKVTEHLPDTKIYYLSIFCAPQKKDHWDVVDAANRLIRDYSNKTKNRAFIDANAIVFDKKGQPRTELYREDGLHFKPATYGELAKLLKPILEKEWASHGM